MDWLSRPKVLFGLLINAAYILFCLATAAPHGWPHSYKPAHLHKAQLYAPLPPPQGPTKATSYYAKESDQLNVYLTNDLTLVKRAGHMLLLSPTFIMQGHSTEPPRTVLLRFFSFSDAQFFTDESPLIITADDVTAWPDTALFDGYPTPTGARVLHSATTDENSHVAETFGIEIPFETFVEIISAKRVIISLGPDRVELTAEQIEALRDMYRRIPQPPGATSSDRF